MNTVIRYLSVICTTGCILNQVAYGDADIPPNGNPVDWACQDTLEPVSEEKIAAFCEAHPPGQRGKPAPDNVRYPTATLSDLDAKNAYDVDFAEFLTDGSYAKPIDEGGLGWFADKNWRLTGPVIGEVCETPDLKNCSNDAGSGYLKYSEQYGVHPAVRIYYSPEVVDWLCNDRKGKIKDGAMIIKRMAGLGGLSVNIRGEERCIAVNEPPSGGFFYAPWVRANDVSYDGWYWGAGVDVESGNPPIFDRSAATSKDFATPVPPKPDPDWYPTGDSKIPNIVYPSNMFAPYCLNCHASARSESTFSSLDNILESGIEYRLYAQPPARSVETLELAELEAAPAVHMEETEAAPNQDSAPGRAPFNPPLVHPTQAFLDFYDQIEPVDFPTAWATRLPAETFDHRFSGPGGPGQFVTSDQCQGCHDATISNSALPNMVYIQGEGDDAKWFNLSPWATWRVSPMGLAGRDPIFFSQLQSETNTLPALTECIENTCLHCHGVMGQRQLAIDTGPDGSKCKDLFPVPPPDEVPFGDPFRLRMVTQYQDADGVHPAKYGNLARDGISCAVCHHIADTKHLGTEPNYTGNFVTGPGDVIYGPYKDDTIVPKPMQNALGITPEFGAQLPKSEVCTTCHNILLPVFDNNGRRVGASYEQTTGLEWNNSDFGKWNTPAFRSCADCHMPTHFDGEQLKFKIANIESDRFAPTTERLPDADITLTERDHFARHTLAGLNVFINEMFQQFPLILGLRQMDYMNQSVIPPLIHGRDAIIDIAQKATAAVNVDSMEKTADGKLKTVVTVTNEAGHYLPSGVGFRRVFIEFQIRDKNGENLWASGRTNDLGVILNGLTESPLPSELPLKYPTVYQPHYQVITEPYQAQIYQELIKDSAGHFTTSFLRRVKDVKDNRVRPKGYDPEFFLQSDSKYIQALAETHGKAADDKYYTDPTLTGADRIEYLVSLDAETMARVDHVKVALYNQSIPPGYLQQRFNDANQGPQEKSEIQRLYYLTSHLNVQAKGGANDEPFIDDWKLELACTTRQMDGSQTNCLE